MPPKLASSTAAPSGIPTRKPFTDRHRPVTSPRYAPPPKPLGQKQKPKQAKKSKADKYDIGDGSILAPTPERMAQPDAPEKSQTGSYHAPQPIERMFRRGQLDHNPRRNASMYDAALKLQRHFHMAGIAAGPASQDLTRAFGGSGDPVSMLPATEAALQHRQEFLRARTIMGWKPDMPNFGSARIVVAVACLDVSVKEAAQMYVGSGSDAALLGAAMDRMRQGLMLLADLWRT